MVLLCVSLQQHDLDLGRRKMLGGITATASTELPWKGSSPGEACYRNFTCIVIKPHMGLSLFSR